MLVRQSLQTSQHAPAPPMRGRYTLIPADGKTIITSQDVYRLMEQEGI